MGNCPLLSTIRTGLTDEWATNLRQECNQQKIEARGTDLRASPRKHIHMHALMHEHTKTHTRSRPRVPQHLHCSVSERLIILTRKQLAGRERHGKLVITVIIITIIIISPSSSRSPSSGSGASYGWVETMKCQEATCAECKTQRLGENRVDSLHSFDFSASPYFGLPHPLLRSSPSSQFYVFPALAQIHFSAF